MTSKLQRYNFHRRARSLQRRLWKLRFNKLTAPLRKYCLTAESAENHDVQVLIRKAFILCAVFVLNCGTNTNTPVIPFIFFAPPGIPQIAGIIPTTEIPIPASLIIDGLGDKAPVKPEFVLKYYVTNTEQNFVGYNLSITSAVPTLADTMAGAAVYTESGILPSFPHLATEANTAKSKIVKRKIANRIPPPGMYPFQHCEVFTFTMRAYLNNGFTSQPSASVAACASPYPYKCPIGSSCNPTACSLSTCTADVKVTCPVGTYCNPCLISGQEGNGCECPAGTSPPGCNP